MFFFLFPNFSAVVKYILFDLDTVLQSHRVIVVPFYRGRSDWNHDTIYKVMACEGPSSGHGG